MRKAATYLALPLLVLAGMYGLVLMRQRPSGMSRLAEIRRDAVKATILDSDTGRRFNINVKSLLAGMRDFRSADGVPRKTPEMLALDMLLKGGAEVNFGVWRTSSGKVHLAAGRNFFYENYVLDPPPEDFAKALARVKKQRASTDTHTVYASWDDFLRDVDAGRIAYVRRGDVWRGTFKGDSPPSEVVTPSTPAEAAPDVAGDGTWNVIRHSEEEIEADLRRAEAEGLTVVCHGELRGSVIIVDPSRPVGGFTISDVDASAQKDGPLKTFEIAATDKPDDAWMRLHNADVKMTCGGTIKCIGNVNLGVSHGSFWLTPPFMMILFVGCIVTWKRVGRPTNILLAGAPALMLLSWTVAGSLPGPHMYLWWTIVVGYCFAIAGGVSSIVVSLRTSARRRRALPTDANAGGSP